VEDRKSCPLKEMRDAKKCEIQSMSPESGYRFQENDMLKNNDLERGF